MGLVGWKIDLEFSKSFSVGILGLEAIQMRPDNALCRAAGFSRIPMFQGAHSFIISTTFFFQEFQCFKEGKPVLLLSLPLSIFSPAKVKVSQHEGVCEELCPF